MLSCRKSLPGLAASKFWGVARTLLPGRGGRDNVVGATVGPEETLTSLQFSLFRCLALSLFYSLIHSNIHLFIYSFKNIYKPLVAGPLLGIKGH